MKDPKRSFRRPKAEEKTYKSRRAAFRAAKREQGIPVTAQPAEVVKAQSKKGREYGLNDQNRYLYIFKLLKSLFGFGNQKVHIREDKARKYSDGDNQLDHFNAGVAGGKLKKHYFFLKQKGK